MLRALAAWLFVSAASACHDGAAPPGATSATLNPTPTAIPSTDPVPMDAAPPDAGETVIVAEDDGKTIPVARGSVLTFKLQTHAGTGYRWTPQSGVDAGVLEAQGPATSERSSDTPGAPKLDVYRYLASTTGKTEITFALARPFGNSAPARTVRVTIDVH